MAYFSNGSEGMVFDDQRTLLVVLFFAGCLSIFTGIVIMVLKVTQAQ